MDVYADVPTKAVKEFESAYKVFWKGDFEKAMKGFESLHNDGSLEESFRTRVGAYLAACKAKTDSSTNALKDAEDLYLAGVAALNDGNIKDGLKHLEKAVGKDNKNDAYVFALACAYAMNRDEDETVTTLKKAISLNADNKVYGRNNAEIATLAKENKKLHSLIKLEE